MGKWPRRGRLDMSVYFIRTDLESDDYTLSGFIILTQSQIDGYTKFFEEAKTEDFTYYTNDEFRFTKKELLSKLKNAKVISDEEVLTLTKYLNDVSFDLFDGIIDQYKDNLIDEDDDNDDEDDDDESDSTSYQKRPEPEPTVELKENNKVIGYGKGDPIERTHVARFIAHILSKLNELKPELPYCKVNQQMFDYLIKNRSGMLYPVNQLHGNSWIKAKITPNISVIIDNDLKYGAFTVGGFEIERDREITVELTKDVN